MTTNFSILEAAGITVSEFARLAGVSRPTASGWINGHRDPHPWIAERVDRLLGSIHKAVSANALPVYRPAKSRDLTDQIHQILREHPADIAGDDPST